jgi:hypothetical protein
MRHPIKSYIFKTCGIFTSGCIYYNPCEIRCLAPPPPSRSMCHVFDIARIVSLVSYRSYRIARIVSLVSYRSYRIARIVSYRIVSLVSYRSYRIARIASLVSYRSTWYLYHTTQRATLPIYPIITAHTTRLNLYGYHVYHIKHTCRLVRAGYRYT